MRVPPLTRLLAGTAVAALALAGCSAGSTATEDPATDGDTTAAPAGDLTVALTAEPANLDFTRSAGAAIPQALLYNVYEGLVKLSTEGEIEPSLATDWTVSEDGTVYDFTLQEGVTFSNGDPFTAETVVFSLERVTAEWTANAPGYMEVVESVEAVSDTEVQVTLSQPSNSWLFNMTGPVGAMFTPDGVDALESTAIGTGPYVVDTWTPGTSLVLATNEDYWGEAPGTSTVTLRYFEDATASANALLAGDVDLIYSLNSPQLVGQFETDDQFQVIQGTTNGEVTLAMNNQRPPFDDVRVRQAVLHAVDQQAVIDTAYSGYGTPLGSMVPPTDPWYDADLLDLYPYDPDRARELLAEAGATDLEVAFQVPNLPYATATAQVVQSQLAEVGIDATIEPLEFPAVWLDEVFTAKDYDLSVIQHSEPRDITTFGDPSYYFGYDNPEVAALFESADTADEETYVAEMSEAARIIAEDAAAGWVFLFPMIAVGDAELTGVPENQTSLALDLATISWG